MLMEGTGKYFWLLFLVFLIVYIAVKISLGVLFKRAKQESWKAYVPVYTTYVLVKLLNIPTKTFYMSLIPFVGLYYLYLITKELLIDFRQNPKEAIWYVIFPMYNFPKLAFKKPKFALNEYDLTEEFLETQNILFEKPKEIEEVVPEVSVTEPVQMNTVETANPEVNNVVSGNSNIGAIPMADFNNIMPVNQTSAEESVFTNESLEPDKTHTTYVEAAAEEVKEEKPIITPANTGRPKMCPKCGARLAPDATACVLCGTKL